MYKINLDPDALSIISSNDRLQNDVDLFIEDNMNVNPIEEEIILAKKNVETAIQCMIIATNNNLIQGPYTETHFGLIKKELPTDIRQSNFHEFWNIFSFECACTKEENRKYSNQYLYMQAIYNILVYENYISVDKAEILTVANLNTGKLEKLQAKGVFTRFK